MIPTTSTKAARASFFALAFAGYTLCTLVLMYPVVRHLSSRVPHDLGDPLLSATLLWWNAHVVPLTARWWDGFGFWPSSGMLAFSDHRLGETLIAAPLQWTGLSALTAYNVTLLATFPMCAIAAHWMAFTLTGRHDASLLAGLAFGFNPYRFAHIEHIELLAAFGMPAALAALHLYDRDRHPKWLIVFSSALLLQALMCSYYFLFFLVMLGLWMAWFLRGGDRHFLVGIATGIAVVLLLLSPLAWFYRAIHHHYRLTRSLNDIVELSGDLTSLVTASPLLAIWGWTAPLNGPERQLFPGATLTVLVGVGAIGRLRSRRATFSENRLSLLLVATACAFALIAAGAWRYGPWHIGHALSVGVPFKPLSLAFWALVGALAASTWARDKYRRRSALTFYLLASAFLFLCSLGPKPAFLGHEFLYEPPYAWLMRLSVFGESVRVPARFAMLAILALSAAGALAFVRLTRPGPSSLALACAVATAMLVESWPVRLPLLDPPAAWPATIATAGVAAFVELPLGETDHDVAAMYRSSTTGLPAVNGYSGYAPSHYEALRLALDERDDSVLEALASTGRILVVVDRRADGAAERLQWLGTHSSARIVATDRDRTWFEFSAPPAAHARCSASFLPIAAASDARGPVDLGTLTDRDARTFWITPRSQQVGDTLLLDLGRVAWPCSIQLSLGSHVALFPRMLNVATSSDGESWQTSFVGRTAGQAVLSAVATPLDARIEIGIGKAAARFIRLRLEASHPKIPWIVTELAVTAWPQE